MVEGCSFFSIVAPIRIAVCLSLASVFEFFERGLFFQAIDVGEVFETFFHKLQLSL